MSTADSVFSRTDKENIPVKPVKSGTGVGVGKYKLFILVGHRPSVMGVQEPLLFRLGRWI
jgi:hypothetical protein